VVTIRFIARFSKGIMGEKGTDLGWAGMLNRLCPAPQPCWVGSPALQEEGPPSLSRAERRIDRLRPCLLNIMAVTQAFRCRAMTGSRLGRTAVAARCVGEVGNRGRGMDRCSGLIGRRAAV
jgi:hypothetical protein